MIHLIQGFFFHRRPQIGIGYDSSGARALIHEVVLRFMFSGAFGPVGPDPEKPEDFIGRMTDHYGESQLTNIKLGTDSLSFTKIYDHRKDPILYQFKKDAIGTWRGTFTGEVTGSGQAHCILTTVPENFVLPEEEIAAHQFL